MLGVLEDHGTFKVPCKLAEQDDLEAKRAANIAAKVDEREKREGQRRRSSVTNARRPSVAGAAHGQAAKRASLSTTKDELDEQRRTAVEEKGRARRASIADAEVKRERRQSIIDAHKKDQLTAKYARKEIMTLFELFNEYDADGGGFISVAELKAHFTKLAESKTHYDGKKKSFADRRAARAHIDMAALVEPMFEAIDVDSDGTVTFFELLKVIYPKANEQDFAVFKEWVYPPKPHVEPINYVLSTQQKRELKEMFHVIDVDHSGELTIEELKKMFLGSAVTGDTGIEMDELQQFFDEADFDNSSSINLPEFERLMISTGLYVPETPEGAPGSV